MSGKAYCCLEVEPFKVQEGAVVCTMAAYSESTPVFRARCAACGLDEAETESLVAAGLTTLAKVAFCSAYTPGAGDDGSLILALSTALGKEPTLGQKASFRRLFHESFSVTTHEMKGLVSQTEESAPRKLSVPERAERHSAIVKRLPGLDIRNRTEPSDSLLDLCVSMYENNKLLYVEWDRLTSKEQEQTLSAKREKVLSVDAAGMLRTEKSSPAIADTSTELLLLLAMTRRAVAFEMANLLDYNLHARWSERLQSARLDPVLAGHLQPTFQQLQAADRRLFMLLADRTRTGIQLNATGKRPLDLIFVECTQASEVLHLLQPLPKAQSGPSPPNESADRGGPYPRGRGRGRSQKGGRKALARAFECPSGSRAAVPAPITTSPYVSIITSRSAVKRSPEAVAGKAFISALSVCPGLPQQAGGHGCRGLTVRGGAACVA